MGVNAELGGGPDEREPPSDELSGFSIALGLLVSGVTLGLLRGDPLGGITPFVAAGLVLVGASGFLLELESSIGRSLGVGNSAVGVLLFVPSLWILVEYGEFQPRWISVITSVACVCGLALGAAALLDGVWKVLAAFFASGFSWEAVLKTLGVVTALTASTLAIVQQALDLA